MKTKFVTLSPADYDPANIVSLLDAIGIKVGADPTTVRRQRLDNRKVSVSQAVRDEYFTAGKALGIDQSALSCAWAIIGPKAVFPSKELAAIVEEGYLC